MNSPNPEYKDKPKFPQFDGRDMTSDDLVIGFHLFAAAIVEGLKAKVNPLELLQMAARGGVVSHGINSAYIDAVPHLKERLAKEYENGGKAEPKGRIGKDGGPSLN